MKISGKNFTSLKTVCRETKLKEFQYKLIHRIVVTKKELYRYGIKGDDEYIYCDEKDSIDHLLEIVKTNTLLCTELITVSLNIDVK